MKVLVTGASGAIGTDGLRRAAGARRRGRRAHAQPREGQRRRSPKVVWHAWDPTLERPPGEALEGVDGVINLVGEAINQRWTDEAKKRILESRETATQQPRRGDRRRRPASRRCWSASPRSATTATRGDAVIDESAPPVGPLRLAGLRRLGGGRARGRGLGRPAGDHAHRPRPRQGLGPAQGAARPVQARRRRAARRRRLLHALDHARTTRSGCCSGRSTPSRASGVYNATAPEPGDQPGVLEGARQGARPAGGHAGAEARRGRPARRRDGRRPRRAGSARCRAALRTAATCSGTPTSSRGSRPRSPRGARPARAPGSARRARSRRRRGGQRRVARPRRSSRCRGSSRDRPSRRTRRRTAVAIERVVGALDRVEDHRHRLVAVGGVAARPASLGLLEGGEEVARLGREAARGRAPRR